MIVCLCNPVSDRAIRACAGDGCASFREMAVHLGIAQQCGRCAVLAKEIFDDARPRPVARLEVRGRVAANPRPL
ncbi:MAG: (2Fe-2S)-binding protein [Burkholderiales bacterium]|nr:(2Fe-2S)-binding protein [Burkholderiales bacterium]